MIDHLSVSQIKEFELCPRKWFLHKIAKVPQPTSRSQALGTEVHAQLEHYLTTGEDVLGPIARAGKDLLPAPGADLRIEVSFADLGGLSAAGIPLQGYIDVLDPRDVDTCGIVRVIDHKTTSNLQYLKPGPALATDTQMVGYAEIASRAYPAAREAELVHIGYQTRGPKDAKRSAIRVDLTEVHSAWKRVEHTVEHELKPAARATDPLEVKGNLSACDAYGGCPYQSICHDPLRRLMTPKGPASMPSMMDMLMKAKSAPAVPPSTAPIPVAAPNGAPIQPAAQTVRGPEFSPQQQVSLGVNAHGEPVRRTLVIEDKTTAAIEAPPAIVPPDAPVSVAVPPPAPVAPAPEPKKRGRPAKAAAVPAVDPKVTPIPDVVPEVLLYVDCAPSGPFEDLTAYVLGLAAKVAAEFKVGDIQIPPKDSPLAYGGWKGALRIAAKAHPLPPGRYVVRSGELADPVIEALTVAAAEVVHGY